MFDDWPVLTLYARDWERTRHAYSRHDMASLTSRADKEREILAIMSAGLQERLAAGDVENAASLAKDIPRQAAEIACIVEAQEILEAS